MRRSLIFALHLIGACPFAVSATEAPQGHLLIIGGGDRPASVMGAFARLAGGASGKVLVFPQASELPETGPRLQKELRDAGAGEVVIVGVTRAEADSDAALRSTQGATGVFFAGGDQAKLVAALRGTRLAARLHELYHAGAVIGGTSAGAAVMSRVMITGDERRPLSKEDSWQTIEAGNVVTGEGFGFLEGAIVDQHFVRRRRHNRLISLVLENPRLLGIGIDEKTAVWVKPDRTFEVIGEGPVLVIDGSSGVVAAETSTHGLTGAGLQLHVLRTGQRYDLERRTLVQPSGGAR